MLSILQNASYWIVVLPLVIGVLCYQRLSHPSKIILAITIFATPPQFISKLTSNEQIQNILYNVYTPIELLLVFILFWPLVKNKIYHGVLKVTFVIYFLAASSIIKLHGIADEVLDCLICINNLLYCFWTLLFLFHDIQLDFPLMRSTKSLAVYITTIFVYASVTSVYFAVKPYADEKNINIKVLHNLPNIQMYVVFAIGFLMDSIRYKKQAAVLHPFVSAVEQLNRKVYASK